MRSIIGIGKINAAVNTASLIRQHKPDVVVNFGSCGSVKHFPIGEVLKVGRVVNDIDVMNISKDRDIILQGKGDITCCTTDHFYDKSRKVQSKTFNHREDIDIVESVQKGMESPAFNFGRIVHDPSGSGLSEHGVHHFHGLVLDAYATAVAK